MDDRERMFGNSFREALDRCLADPVFSQFQKILDEETNQRLQRYAFALAEANKEVNLTAITDPAEMAVKHVADSLLALTVGRWPNQGRMCDVGTGGGLPGAVLGIVHPKLQVTLVDSVQKKLRIVNHLCAEVGLAVDTIHGRAEDLGRTPSLRESFDVVTARAVARLPVLLELCLPLTKVQGFFVALKGPDAKAEIEESGTALQLLGGEIGSVREVQLPLGAGRRTLIEVRKIESTPSKYPRSPGMPAKNPL